MQPVLLPNELSEVGMNTKFIALLILLVGCQTAESIYLADGRHAYITHCDTTKYKCYVRASRTCGNLGYEIMEENKMDESTGSFGAAGGYAAGKVQSNTQMSMMFVCKPWKRKSQELAAEPAPSPTP